MVRYVIYVAIIVWAGMLGVVDNWGAVRNENSITTDGCHTHGETVECR